MKPGFYVVESRKNPKDRTVIEVDFSGLRPVMWIGGEQCSTVEQLHAEWRVIAELELMDVAIMGAVHGGTGSPQP